ncbi:hypothetical protein FA04_26970 (plasmid) [Ensifer adhaerens]|nr:hypothetical protein FA04_26970 [Ensifer adhaerens]KDP73235.1 hypothetical protein FA04_12730 [Ensifer adhaerens]KQX05904.1 hypothetical protein ASD01_09825 [Ensifer sp. Root423]KSV66195.1 hypothetical protein N182_35310 [Sinorhizobium sp. GL2]
MLEAAAGLHEDDLVNAFRRGVDPAVNETGIFLAPEMPRDAGIGDVARTIKDRTGRRLVSHW